MNTNNINSDVNRRNYASPQIEQVLLDNAISLTLDSLMINDCAFAGWERKRKVKASKMARLRVFFMMWF